MSQLHGEYECKLDAKGRLIVPAALKKQLPKAAKNSFFINRGFEKCLSLYPMKTWEAIADKISKLNDFDPKVRQFKLLFLGGATEVELDSAGRMLLPPSLKEFAGLSKDIVLASSLDKINIWDAAKYKQFFEAFSPEDFSALGNEVMGKGNVE